MQDIQKNQFESALKALQLVDPQEYAALLELSGKIGEIEAVEQAKTNFLEFVKYLWPSVLLGPHHKKMAEVIEGMVLGDKKRSIVNMAPRMPYALDTPVPTINGWSTIGALRVGDWVFRPDGSPVQVTGKSPVYREQLYEVTTNDGCRTRCSGSHEWYVRIDQSGFHRKSTLDLFARQERLRSGSRPVLFPTGAVQYLAQPLPIDPYVLGVWLGDGHSSQAVITSHDNDQPEIRAQFEKRGYVTTDQSTKMTFGVHGLRVKLGELGLLGNKHVPEKYLIGSIEQRFDLLRGLMDTDGCVHKRGQCVFSQKNKGIVEAARQLVLSLGGKCKIYETRAVFKGVDYGPQWCIAFFLKDCAYLERKRSRTRDIKIVRSIEIRKLDEVGDVQCIQVSDPIGLFQGADYCCFTNSKSELFSCYMPAWYLGHNPHKKIIQICGTSEMAIGWSRKVRNIVASEEYQKIFPGVGLRADSKSAGRWHTSHNGEYFAVGAEGNVTGKGGDIIIIDDPTGEQQAVSALTDPGVYRKVYDWYVAGPRQRLQPGGRICVVQSRWSINDFTGQLLKAEREADSPLADKWEVIELPAILPSGKSIWPEFWPLEQLEATRLSLPPQRWNAQYLQQPGAAESALLKRDYWKRWEGRQPPEVMFKLVTMDTAYSDKETADFTAVTTWGVFRGESAPHYNKFGNLDPGGKEIDCLILLDAWKDRINFPDLKTEAHKYYLKWQPDVFLIEAKASGVPLLHELRARGIPVSEYTPVRGAKSSPNTKIVRANAVTDILASGLVYAPRTRWAEDVIEECDGFPELNNDDYVDCVVMALMRFRQGGLISLPSDDWGEEKNYRRRRKYY